MQPLNADDDPLAAQEIDDHLAFAHDGALILADLLAISQVETEGVLAVQHESDIYLGLEPEPGADGLGDAPLVDDGQHPGHGGIDQAHMGVGLTAERGRGAGEQLGVRGDLRMHLHADHHLPGAGLAFDEIVLVRLSVHCGRYSLPSSCWRSFSSSYWTNQPIICRHNASASSGGNCFSAARVRTLSITCWMRQGTRASAGDCLSCQARST